MKAETKYAYEKRIKELESQLRIANSKLFNYRSSAMEIFDGVCEVISKKENISMPWVLQRLKRCFE